MRVVVTGGLGAVGSRVVQQLRSQDHDAVVASRRTGVDVATGEGLEAMLEDAEAVVHTADSASPRARSLREITVGGARRVAEAAARAPRRPHLVTLSIVGCAEVPYVYYRAKAAADEAVLASEASATVVAATQFHSLAAYFARLGGIGPVVLGLRGMRIQPVEIDWVAQRLAEMPGLAAAIAAELKDWDTRSIKDELDVLRRFAGQGQGQGADPSEDPPVPGKPPRPTLPGGRAKTTFQIPRPQGNAKCVAANGRLEVRLPRDFSTIDRRRLEAAVAALLDQID